MRKVIHFSKFFVGAVILSLVLIASGIVSVVTRGINFGLDFKPGMIEEFRIDPTVLELTYGGSATITVDPSETGLDLVVSGVGAENRTVTLRYEENPTVADLAQKISEVEGIGVNVLDGAVASGDGLFVNSAVSTTLGATPLRIHAADDSVNVNADDVRAALADIEGADVKTLGSGKEASYQIRLGVAEGDTQQSIQERTNAALTAAFGADKVAIVKSDFIGAQFSRTLIRDSVVLVLLTLVLIWLYSTIRFHWDFALAAVIAIIHDALIMVTFITWSQMEFSTTTLAAILTIIGYSINATVVILDRVRSNMKHIETDNFTDILNISLTETLSRSVITTVTTLFAVVSLFVFTTGTIHDFALALIVGLLSGAYSSIFIAGAFISCVRRSYTNKGLTTSKANNIVQFQA
ncbi:MAG: protein translocase subunit SecF [Treponemataceae bacterium]|nr:protein translocase subunit SecF [Treponemataceae bacterium]